MKCQILLLKLEERYAHNYVLRKTPELIYCVAIQCRCCFSLLLLSRVIPVVSHFFMHSPPAPISWQQERAYSRANSICSYNFIRGLY